jgi:lysophospholipase L1-like esterase
MMIVLVLLLAFSALLNVVLMRRFFDCYRRLQMICLDPAGLGAFEERPLPPDNGQAEPLVILLGDSRIAQWSPCPTVAGCRIVNRGVSGQTTAMALLHWERDALLARASVAVIQIGINDLKQVGLFPERARLIVDSCWRNIRELVDRMVASNLDVVLLTVFPTGPVGLLRRPIWSEGVVAAVDEINGRLLRLNGPRVSVLDCDPVLMSGRRLRREYAHDTLHLTPKAYEALNARLAPVLQELMQNRKTE